MNAIEIIKTAETDGHKIQFEYIEKWNVPGYNDEHDNIKLSVSVTDKIGNQNKYGCNIDGDVMMKVEWLIGNDKKNVYQYSELYECFFEIEVKYSKDGIEVIKNNHIQNIAFYDVQVQKLIENKGIENLEVAS